MNVYPRVIDGKNLIVLDLRPYMFGIPTEEKDRKPSIAYQKEFDAIFEDIDDDEKDLPF